MKIRKKLKATDINLIAHAIGEAATDTKNPAAMIIGSVGGKIGGNARAVSLTPERRQEIAKIAAEARWKKTTN
jgi:hypothetical protein